MDEERPDIIRQNERSKTLRYHAEQGTKDTPHPLSKGEKNPPLRRGNERKVEWFDGQKPKWLRDQKPDSIRQNKRSETPRCHAEQGTN